MDSFLSAAVSFSCLYYKNNIAVVKLWQTHYSFTMHGFFCRGEKTVMCYFWKIHCSRNTLKFLWEPRMHVTLTNIKLHVVNKWKTVGPRQRKASLLSVSALCIVDQQCETKCSIWTAFLLYTIINHWEQFYYSYYLAVASFVEVVFRYFILFSSGSTNECLFIIPLCCLAVTVEPLKTKHIWVGWRRECGGGWGTLVFELLGSSKWSTVYLFLLESRIRFN